MKITPAPIEEIIKSSLLATLEAPIITFKLTPLILCGADVHLSTYHMQTCLIWQRKYSQNRAQSCLLKGRKNAHFISADNKITKEIKRTRISQTLSPVCSAPSTKELIDILVSLLSNEQSQNLHSLVKNKKMRDIKCLKITYHKKWKRGEDLSSKLRLLRDYLFIKINAITTVMIGTASIAAIPTNITFRSTGAASG